MQRQTLRNKIVVITGASSGLGRAIAFEAASQKATVILLGRNTTALEDVKNECHALSHQPAFCYHLDISDQTGIDQVHQKIIDRFLKIDVLVNCAGFGVFENTVDIDWSTVESMFAVNVLGLLYFSRLIAKDMIDMENGQIINIASMAAKMATPKTAIYSATKSAVVGFSNGLRLELRPFGVKVTTVNLGPMATNFFKIADKTGNYLDSVKEIALDPDRVAKKVVQSMYHPVREINLPVIMEIGAKLYNLFPRMGDFFAANFGNQK